MVVRRCSFTALLIAPLLLAAFVGAQTPAPDAKAAVAPAQPVVAIVKGTDVDKMVAEAIELSGGLADLVKPGQKVVIKPNLTNWYGRVQPGMCTDIRVARAVLENINKTAKCKLTFAEGSGLPAKEVFDGYGYTKLADENGAELVDLAMDPRTLVKNDKFLAFKEYNFPTVIKNADVFIDLPVLKTHCLAGITVGMKNYFGTLPNPRDLYHDRVDEVLADLVSIRKPDLIVVDGLVGMEGQGPLWGQPVKMDIVVAGRDIVAVDAVCATIMGFDPNRVLHVVNAARIGLGEMDLSKIVIKGTPISEVRREFRYGNWQVKVERPKTDADVKRLVELADSKREDRWGRGGWNLEFNAERLKVDSARYPLRKSYGFSVTIPGKGGKETIEISVPYEALLRENIPAATEEIQAWIKENLDTAPAATTAPAGAAPQVSAGQH